jgi:hypothetical protein
MARRKKKGRDREKDFRPFLRRPIAGPIFLALTLILGALMFLMLRPAHTGTGLGDAWQSIIGRPMPSQPNLALTTLFGILTMGSLMLSAATMSTFIAEVWSKLDQRRATKKTPENKTTEEHVEVRVSTQSRIAATPQPAPEEEVEERLATDSEDKRQAATRSAQ